MNFDEIKNKYNLEKISLEKENLEKKIIESKNMNMSELVIELNRKTKIYELVKKLKSEISQYEEIVEILKQKNEPDMVEMAENEKKELETKIQETEEEIKRESYAHILEDPDDSKAIILEIRAGAGGDEASIFATDLFRMYSQYASSMNWNLNIIENSKEIIAQISGKNIFKKLKYESGVHRVQRVPTTESSGRIHTSTVSVAVLPEAKEIDVQIDPADLRIDVMRSSGAGGQSVNKTDSAIRITHLPTNIVASCQETKYQQQNKDKAMAILRSRLYEREKMLEQEKRSSLRLSQIGSAMRAEKIRTYNFPQNRITDHRIKKSWHNLENVLNGDLNSLLGDLDEGIKDLKIIEIDKEEKKNG